MKRFNEEIGEWACTNCNTVWNPVVAPDEDKCMNCGEPSGLHEGLFGDELIYAKDLLDNFVPTRTETIILQNQIAIMEYLRDKDTTERATQAIKRKKAREEYDKAMANFKLIGEIYFNE